MPGTIANANARQTQDDSVLAKIIELSIVELETLPDAAIQRDNASRQLRVAPVAKRRVLRVLAAAPRDGFGFGDFRFQRRKAGAFVRAVAKRLALGPAARAPEGSAGFNFLDERRFLSNGWFHHAPTIIAFRKNATCWKSPQSWRGGFQPVWHGVSL
jgi:hypothetical protein